MLNVGIRLRDKAALFGVYLISHLDDYIIEKYPSNPLLEVSE